VDNALAVFPLDTTLLTNGMHTIAWIVTDNEGHSAGIGSRYFRVLNGSTAALTAASHAAPIADAAVDSLPLDRSPIAARRGFDLDGLFTRRDADAGGRIALTGEELDRFDVQLDAAAAYTGYLRTPGGLAPLPIGSRLDPVSNVFSWQPGAGFVGRYEFVFVRALPGSASTRREVDIVLAPKGTLTSPRVVIDTPGPSAVFGPGTDGAFAISGWALDGRARSGNGIDAVHVWAYPFGGGAPIFIGDAPVAGARPDVALVHGPVAQTSGYTLSARGLPPGAYLLAVFGHSTVTGEFLPAATVPILVR
jgi:hypothetical protein